MKKLALLVSVLLMASVVVFADNEGGQTQAPETVKDCVKRCRDEAKGCIGAAENNRAEARKCRHNELACRKSCIKDCQKRCGDNFSGCMNTVENNRAEQRKCRNQNNACRRSCR